MGDLYVCNSAFHISITSRRSQFFTFAGIFLYFSLSTLSLSTPTLFSLIIIIIIVATVSNRIELNYYYYVNESTSHTTFFFYRLLSTIVTCTDTYLKTLYLLII